MHRVFCFARFPRLLCFALHLQPMLFQLLSVNRLVGTLRVLCMLGVLWLMFRPGTAFRPIPTTATAATAATAPA